MGRPRLSRLLRLFIVTVLVTLLALVVTTAGALVAGPAAANPAPAPTLVPAPTTAEVRAQVDDLYRQAEQASERHNEAQVGAEAAQDRLRQIQAQIEARRGELTARQSVVGKIAASTYRSGAVDPAMLLVFSDHPEDFLRQAATLATVSERQSAAMRRLAETQRRQDMDRARVREQAALLTQSRDELGRERTAMEQRLAEAEALLGELAAGELARLDAADRAAGELALAEAWARRAAAAASRSRSGDPLAIGPIRAVDAAFGQLGKPYVWGATGPGAFDCSGLTGYVWRASGVGLPRTSGAQYAAGRRISRADLQPGDLVYYYSPISHVGIYIGGGQIIHAPRPGRPVMVAPVDSMPFVGATRP